MPDPPCPLTEPCASNGKRKCSEQGWIRRKERDARRSAEHYEPRDALARPQYTLGAVDERQHQVHLEPLVPEKFVEASFERFREWFVRALGAKWPAAAVIRLNTNKPQGGHWTSDLWCAQLGGTRSPEPFITVTASNYALLSSVFSCEGRRISSKVFGTSFSQHRHEQLRLVPRSPRGERCAHDHYTVL